MLINIYGVKSSICCEIYDFFMQVIPHINDPYAILVAILSENFHIQFTIVIGSSLLHLVGSKTTRGKAIYSKNYLVALNQR